MDQKLYRKTFDQVHMPAERAAQVRRELAARTRNESELEAANNMNSKKTRRPAAVLLALCAVMVLTVTAFASGGKVLERVFQMMTLSDIQQSVDENGNYLFEDSSAPSEPVSPVERRDDGRLYLTINGENLDITDKCSYETPYIYECTGEDGLRHSFIIGGDPDDIGWAEYVLDEDDDTAVGCTVFSAPDSADLKTLPWLKQGLQKAAGIESEQTVEINGTDMIMEWVTEPSSAGSEDADITTSAVFLTDEPN